MTRTQRVPVTPGELLVVAEGKRTAPTVVLVHGYPDTHELWDEVAADLRTDHHVVRYDVRGAGGSSAPRTPAGYGMAHLLDDLIAVVDATSDGAPVHLVGHDWGAIQGFAAVRTPSVAARLASFTAVSAPGLEVARWWLHRRLTAPSPTGLLAVVRQVGRSWYTGAFQVPVLPELVVRASIERVMRRTHPHPSPTLVTDAVRGIGLYRANGAPAGLLDPVGDLPAGPPVQVVTGREDPFVTPRVFDDLRDRLGVPVHEVDGAHWLPITHADVVAAHVRALVSRTRRD